MPKGFNRGREAFINVDATVAAKYANGAWAKQQP